MPSRAWTCAVVTAFAFAVLSAGCSPPVTVKGPKNNAVKSESAAADSSASDESENPKPFCAGWDKPVLTFAVTGQMHGYLEPCGCAEPQYGGIARRADLLRQLKERGWQPVAVDLGGTLKRSRQQSQFKFQTLMQALRDMNYAAMALGVEDLRLGAGWLLSQHESDPDDPSRSMNFLASNVVLFGTPDLGTPVPWKVIDVAGRKIGLAAVFDPALLAQLGTLDESEISVSDPAEALKKTVKALKAESVDLMVLLSHSKIDTSKKLAQQFPEFQLVLSTGPIEDPQTGNPQQIGESTLFVVGHKGKYTGLVGWYPDLKEQPFRTELVKLDGKRFKNAPKMLDHMRFYQELLKDSKLAETEPTVRHSSGADFVGAEKCGECHTKAFAKWSTTGHAKAFESLRKGRRGIPRLYDPECLACHVAGWHPQEVFRYETGYLNEKASAHLLGNQCENCHGPGSKHIELVESGELIEARKLVRVTKKQAENSACYSCHDLDNSPHFSFETYWPKIAHPGLD